MQLAECPRKAITAQSAVLMMMAELYKKGLPPVHGGSLDQTQAFVTAARFIWSESAMCEMEARQGRKTNG